MGEQRTDLFGSPNWGSNQRPADQQSEEESRLIMYFGCVPLGDYVTFAVRKPGAGLLDTEFMPPTSMKPLIGRFINPSKS
jgi:hypothetical protein